jgi:uncharacterized protein YacL
MSETDWFKVSKAKLDRPTLQGVLQYLWAAICAGTGSGIALAAIILIYDQLKHLLLNSSLHNPSIDFLLNAGSILLALFGGGAIGLVFGTPIAFLFGPAILRITEKMKPKLRLPSRLLSGAIGGLLIGLFIGLWGSSSVFALPYELYVLAGIAGIIGALIFQHLAPRQQMKEQTP